jgi:hypothetical protein
VIRVYDEAANVIETHEHTGEFKEGGEFSYHLIYLRIAGLGLFVSLFIASLGFNTLILSKGDSSFLIGIICLLLGFSYLPWFANPLFVLGVIFVLSKRFSLALAASVLSAILATTTLFIREAPYNEAGHMACVIGYGPRFYLWLASISVLLLTSLLASFLKTQH